MEQKEKTEKKPARTRRNREYTVIAYFFLFIFIAMIAYFVYFQFVISEKFINSPYNSLQNLFSDRVVRGQILSSDGKTLAETKVSKDGTEQRVYPYANMYAHAVGYAVNGKSGLENQCNFDLLRSHQFFLEQIFDDISGNKSEGDAVVTTLDSRLQEVAYKALGNYDGAVLVLEPSTGKILAMVSKPDYNPETIAKDWESINNSESSVLYNRATQGKYAPGSIFKIFTALEYYREHPKTYKNYSYDCTSSITVDGHVIHCAGNKAHGTQDLKSAFAHSCNSSFADIGLKVNNDSLQKTCEELLFNKDLPIAFESSKSKFALKSSDSAALTMQTCIGQGNTMVSPLHMAMVAGSICNKGVLMTPYLVDHTQNANGVIVSENEPVVNRTLMSKKEAKVLESFMEAVVTEGTGSKLNGQSYKAYGKTGTAQVSDTSDQTNAWFVGYAKKEGYQDIAVAVVVENSGAGSTYAVPIAKQVFDVHFNK